MMVNRVWVVLIFILCSRFIFSSGENHIINLQGNINKKTIDSLIEQADQYSELSYSKSLALAQTALGYSIKTKYIDGQVLSMAEISRVLVLKKNINTAIFFMNQINYYYKELLNPLTRSKVLYLRAIMEFYYNDPYIAIKSFEKAIEHSEKYKHYKYWGLSNLYYARLYSNIWDEKDIALQQIDKSINIFSECKDSLLIANCYLEKGFYYLKINDSAMIFKNLKQSEKIYRKFNSEKYLASNLLYEGDYFSHTEDYKTALDYYYEVLYYAKKNDLYIIVGDVYTRISNCYDKLHNKSKELEYNFLSLAIRKKIGLVDRIASSYLNIGITYMNMNKTKFAIMYLKKAFTLANQINNKHLMQRAMYYLSILKDKKKNYKDIYRSFVDYHLLSMKIIDEKGYKRKSIFRYKQEKEISINEINKHKLSNQNYFIVLLIVIVILIIIIIFIISFLYYSKKKENLLIEKQKNDLQKALEKLSASEAVIKSSLEEKDYLIKEIHHRVKNNLQIIISLFELKSDIIQNEAAKLCLVDTKARIKTISLIHEILYNSENFAYINFSDYIDYLIVNIRDTFDLSINNIKLIHSIDNIEININKALPCGLIINEIITNAIKHAFPDGRAGEINITLKNINDKIELIIKDNGKGLNLTENYKKCLGIELITRLVRQLNGNMVVDNTNGTYYNIQFIND